MTKWNYVNNLNKATFKFSWERNEQFFLLQIDIVTVFSYTVYKHYIKYEI